MASGLQIPRKIFNDSDFHRVVIPMTGISPVHVSIRLVWWWQTPIRSAWFDAGARAMAVSSMGVLPGACGADGGCGGAVGGRGGVGGGGAVTAAQRAAHVGAGEGVVAVSLASCAVRHHTPYEPSSVWASHWLSDCRCDWAGGYCGAHGCHVAVA